MILLPFFPLYILPQNHEILFPSSQLYIFFPNRLDNLPPSPPQGGGGIRNFIHPYLRLVELDVPHIEQIGFGSGLPDPDHPVSHANAQDTGVQGVGGEAVDEPVEGRQGVQQLPVPKEGYNKELREYVKKNLLSKGLARPPSPMFFIKKKYCSSK